MEKRNNYFYASAILTILMACIEILLSIIGISLFFSMKESIIAGLNDPNNIDFIQSSIVTLTIISMITGFLTVVVGCFFFSFSKYDQEKVKNRTAFIVIMIILQIIFGGLIACAISVAGIISGQEGEMAKIDYEKVSDNSMKSKLLELKNLHENNLIDDEEYKRLRDDVLKDLRNI